MEIKRIVTGKLRENCYVLLSAEHAAIIDPGDDFESINSTLIGATPELILLTHGHYDHVGAVKALVAQYKAAKICIGMFDAELLQAPEKNMSLWGDQVVSDICADVLLHDGDLIDFLGNSIKVIETPGHTKGSVCYWVEGILFSGDTLFKGAIGRTDLYGGDSASLIKSLEKLRQLDSTTIVYPGHGLKTTIGAEFF
ncbi:MBL fold hydrolase [Clostridia bacterium]|nr:MBL fold hydrolase [Clostridia bacterium]